MTNYNLEEFERWLNAEPTRKEEFDEHFWNHFSYTVKDQQLEITNLNQANIISKFWYLDNWQGRERDEKADQIHNIIQTWKAEVREREREREQEKTCQFVDNVGLAKISENLSMASVKIAKTNQEKIKI